MQLTSTEITQNVIAAANNKLDTKPEPEAHPVEPPKDWAPKIPGTHGMLSEEFGLNETEDADPPTLREGEPPHKPS